jgi:CHAD domain-containing protein
VKKKPTWTDKLDVQANLDRRLPRLADKYLAQGRRALAKGHNWKEVHEFRLATKRLRYTFELFADTYGSALDKPIEQLKHVQTALGDANDCLITAGLIEKVSGMEEIHGRLTAKAESKLKKLRAWWTLNFVSDNADQAGLINLPANKTRIEPVPQAKPGSAPKRSQSRPGSNGKR